jgi:hypothetical protein
MFNLQATVKAGSCQQEFNSLNAEYATMKQGLANLGLTGKTVDEKKGAGTITEGMTNHYRSNGLPMQAIVSITARLLPNCSLAFLGR